MPTFTPATIAISAAEIPNQGRGAYRWYDTAPEPSGWPALDSYMRFDWSQLEFGQGAYNDALLVSYLDAARARGGTFGLRVMPANSSAGGMLYPAYLDALMPLAYTFGANNTRAPDFNDPDYLARSIALIQWIATYANRPEFGWLELSPYGDWGEWHVWQWPVYQGGVASTGAVEMTLANKQSLIDAHVAAFPANKLVAMIDSVTDNNPVLGYAYGKSPLIGVRGDSFGNSHGNDRWTEAAAVDANRWKTAPLIGEFAEAQPGTTDWAGALSQTQTWHIAMCEGNHTAYANLSGTEQANWNEARKRAGYRYRLTNVVATPSAGSLSVTHTWANDGSAPTYHANWRAQFELRDAGNALAATLVTPLDLRTVLPGDAPTATIVGAVAAGTYTLSAVVWDTDGLRSQMQLSQTGRDGVGAYPLGSVTIPTAAVTAWRTVPSTLAALAVGARTVPATVSSRGTLLRTVLASVSVSPPGGFAPGLQAGLLLLSLSPQVAGYARQIPATVAVSWIGVSRTVPVSAAIQVMAARAVPATLAVTATGRRTVPVTVALGAATSRTVLATVAVTSPAQRVVPLSLAVLRGFARTALATVAISASVARTAPASVAVARITSRTIPSSVAVLALGLRTIPATVSIAASAPAPVLGTMAKGARPAGALGRGARPSGGMSRAPYRQ